MAGKIRKNKEGNISNRPIYSVEITFYREENMAHIRFRPLKKGNVRKRDVEIPEDIFYQLSWENYGGMAVTSYRRAGPGYVNRRGEPAPTSLNQKLEKMVLESFDNLTSLERNYEQTENYKQK